MFNLRRCQLLNGALISTDITDDWTLQHKAQSYFVRNFLPERDVFLHFAIRVRDRLVCVSYPETQQVLGHAVLPEVRGTETSEAERDEQAIQRWKKERWPEIKKKPKKRGAPSFSSTKAG